MIDVSKLKVSMLKDRKTRTEKAQRDSADELKKMNTPEQKRLYGVFFDTMSKTSGIDKTRKMLGKSAKTLKVSEDVRNLYNHASQSALHYVLSMSAIYFLKNKSVSQKQIEQNMNNKQVKDVFDENKNLKKVLIKMILDAVNNISESTEYSGNYLIERLDDILDLGE